MDKFPEFALENQNVATVSNKDLKGKTVIYFYPKDNTPGCTTQACDLRDNMDFLNDLGVKVYGVSGDSKKKHQNYIEKQRLNFDLLMDEDYEQAERLGVERMKKVFGKKAKRIVMTTFVVDEVSNIHNRNDIVNTKEHMHNLKEFLQEV